jgi:hypothetical protein
MIGANAAEIIGSYNNAANGGNISRSQMIASLRSAGSLYGSHGGSAFIPTNRPRVNTIGYYQPQQMPSQVTTRDQRLQHTKSLRQALPDSFMTSSQSADNLVKRNS